MPADHTPESDMSLTDWSAIHAAVSDDPSRSEAAWTQLSRRYWPAIFAYVRRSGHDVHEASDLTQGFICDVLMGRHLLQQADPLRGRFRTLLRTALRNYLTERHRFNHRKRRAPRSGPIVSLDAIEEQAPATSADETPEIAYARNWTNELLRQALTRMQAICEEEGQEVQWQIFAARVVRPMLQQGPPIPYGALVELYDLRDAAQAANIAVAARRKFIRLLRGAVRATVPTEQDIDLELAELLRELENR